VRGLTRLFSPSIKGGSVLGWKAKRVLTEGDQTFLRSGGETDFQYAWKREDRGKKATGERIMRLCKKVANRDGWGTVLHEIGEGGFRSSRNSNSKKGHISRNLPAETREERM